MLACYRDPDQIAYTDNHQRCAPTLERWIGSNSGTFAAQSGATRGDPDCHGEHGVASHGRARDWREQRAWLCTMEP